jgi:hypothetical protein
MLCLGVNASPVLVILSDLFYWLFPAGLFVGAVSLLLAVVLPRWPRSACFVAGLALLVLLEPFIFLTYMLAPIINPIDSDTGIARAVWFLLAVLPLALPLSAIWIAKRRNPAPA